MPVMTISRRYARLSFFLLCILDVYLVLGFAADHSHEDWARVEVAWRFPVLFTLVIVMTVAHLIGFFRFGRSVAQQSRRQMVRATVAQICIAVIFISLFVFLVPSGRTHPFVATAQAYVLVSTIIATGFSVAQNQGSLSIVQFNRLALAVVGAALLLSILLIGRVPEVIPYDEPGEVNFAYFKIKESQFFWPLFPTLPPSLVALWWKLPLEIAGRWMQFAGTGVAQMRTVYLTFPWLGLPFIYFVANALYGRVAGLSAITIGAFIPILHNFARPDSFVALTLSIALACLVQGRKSNRAIWHFLAGFSIAFGIEGHAYAVRFVAAFGIYYLLTYFQNMRQTRRGHHAFWSFVGGGLIFGLVYLVFHVISVPIDQRASNFVEFLSTAYGNQAQIASPDVPVSFLQRLVQTNLAVYIIYFRTETTEAVLLCIVIGLALFRRRAADTLLLSLLGVSFVIGIILLAHVSIHYWLFNWPFLAVLTGAAIAQIHRDRQTLTYVGAATIAMITAAFVAQAFSIAVRPQAIDNYLEIGRKIEKIIPEEAHIVGHQVFYLAMKERRDYVDIENYYGDKNFIGGPNITDHFQPDAIIYMTSSFLDDPNAIRIIPYTRQYHLKPAYCFNSNYGDDVIVYLKPEWLPPNPDLTACALPE